MKKKIAALLAALLLVSAVSLAETAALEATVVPEVTPVLEAAQVYTCDGLFSFPVPQGMWLDDQAYQDDFEIGQDWRLMLYDATRAIDVTAVSALGRYEGMSLSTMTDEEVADYRETFLDQNVTQNAEYLEQLDSLDGSMRFLLFSVRDSSGLYYTAETLISGAIYAFDCYRADLTDAQEGELEALRAFLPTLAATR